MNSTLLNTRLLAPDRVACAAQIAALAVVFAGLFVSPVIYAQDQERHETWTAATHGDDAAPDYDRLFAMDRVHELHIRIEPDDYQRMSDDLQSIGPAGMPGMPPGAAGAFNGGFGNIAEMAERFSAAANVCVNQQPDALCSIDDTDGRCRALIGPELVCVPEAVAGIVAGGRGAGAGPAGGFGGFGGFGAGGAPDLIAGDPIYVPVTVSHDGRVWPGVGMRYKGNSSLMTALMSGNGKVPFRLDFDRYEDEMPEIGNQRFYGFHKLTFSSNFSDDSMLKEVLATEVFRDRGVPAARAAFYRVFVDAGEGETYWGLYTMIEDPADGAMLDSQFGGRGGNLYKPNGPGANWSTFNETGFEKKTNEKDADFSDVIAAIDALHASQQSPQQWRESLEATLDVDLFLRWLAVNTVIENWDSYGRLAHNYYLYSDPGDDGTLKWISWDHNMAFGMAGGGGFPGMRGGGFRGNGGPPGGFQLPPGLENIVRDGAAAFFGNAGGDDVLHQQAGEAWPLISRLLADDTYARRYRDELERALDGLLAPEAFEARARELHALITPYAIGVQGEQPGYTTLNSPVAFMQALDGPAGLLNRVRQRQDQVRVALETR